MFSTVGAWTLVLHSLYLKFTIVSLKISTLFSINKTPNMVLFVEIQTKLCSIVDRYFNYLTNDNLCLIKNSDVE